MFPWLLSLESAEVFECFTAGVEQDLMRFLNGCGIFSSNHDGGVAEASGGAAVAAEESYAAAALAASGMDGFQDVCAFSAGGEDDQGVFGADQAFGLTSEDLVVTEIIGDAGEGGRVTVEAGAGERGAIAPKASQEFLGQMQGFSGGAAVPTGVDPAATADDIMNCGNHRKCVRAMASKLIDGLFSPGQPSFKQVSVEICGVGSGGG